MGDFAAHGASCHNNWKRVGKEFQALVCRSCRTLKIWRDMTGNEIFKKISVNLFGGVAHTESKGEGSIMMPWKTTQLQK